MRPDEIIEGTAAEMGCFSQENGTLGWCGGTGEDENCPQVTKGCIGKEGTYSVEAWGWQEAGGGPEGHIS